MQIKQDIYYIVVPIAITVLGWLLPLLKSNESRFIGKWRRKSENASELYGKYLLKLMLFGVIVFLCSALFLFALNWEIESVFGKGLTIENLQIVISLFSAVCNIVVMLLIKINLAQFKLLRMKNHKKWIAYFMYYSPWICSIWIWGVSMLVDTKIVNFIIMLIILACEIVSFVLLDSNRYDEYSDIELFFKDHSNLKCPVEYIDQKGGWIIIRDLDNMCESRYKEEELVSVKYSNEINNRENKVEMCIWECLRNCIKNHRRAKNFGDTNVKEEKKKEIKNKNCEQINEESDNTNRLNNITNWLVTHPIIGISLCIALPSIILQFLYYALVWLKIDWFVEPLSESDLLGFLGEIIGGLIGGVFAVYVLRETINEERRHYKEEQKLLVKPVLVYEISEQEVGLISTRYDNIFDAPLGWKQCIKLKLCIENAGLGSAMDIGMGAWVVGNKHYLYNEDIRVIPKEKKQDIEMTLLMPDYTNYDKEIGQTIDFYRTISYKDILNNTYKQKINFRFDRLIYYENGKEETTESNKISILEIEDID